MSNDLTFKKYLESKARLLEAVAKTPKRTGEYHVRKYCKIPLGESKEDKVYIPLKPKYKILVDWLYTNVDNPTPLALRVECEDPEIADQEFQTFWSGVKLQKWLARNARETLP